MREVFVFRPPRRPGIVFHIAAILILVIIGSAGLWRASLAETDPSFLVYILGALITIGLTPIAIYQIIALERARYILARDGISIYWGLRREEIPINMVNWVGSADQNRMKLSKPILRIPGAVLGVQTQPDGKAMEFLAARDHGLVLIVTADRIYAISPANEAEFLQTYRRLAEFGSLAPIPSISDYPTALLGRAWSNRTARILILTSMILALGLLLWVGLTIPNHPSTALRLNPDGSPLELVPGIRLLLLPVINSFFFIADLLLGLFFYRRADTQSLSYLMWASSSLTSLLFSMATFYILRVT
ncbi:MAG TPA: PH domain-containing protein [Anaerolineales bacterium]|nr:PH domain-containing protein [Anaerolineales bacterium]